jgi:hypothetical protein
MQLASVIGLKFWDAALAHVESQAAEQRSSLRRWEPIVLEGERRGEYAFRHYIVYSTRKSMILRTLHLAQLFERYGRVKSRRST